MDNSQSFPLNTTGPPNPPNIPQPEVMDTQGRPSQSKLPMTLTVLLLLVTLGGVGFLTYQNFQLKQQTIQTSTTNTSTHKPCTQEAKICPDGSAVERVGPNCEFKACPNMSMSPLPTQGTTDSTLIKDGSVYKVSSSGVKKLFIDKHDNKNHPDDREDFFSYISADISPDKSKLLLLAQGGISIPFLYYTPFQQLNIKLIGTSSNAAWSHNSRYIAYISKPADAGPWSILGVYDTKTDQFVQIDNKPVIPNLKYELLGFSNFQWSNDDASIKVHYLAYWHGDNDLDPFGSVVGEGEVVIPFKTNN